MTGIICIDKPNGITSFDVISKLRKILNEKKIGHAGTLDPMATGVLPVLIGGATRFLDFLPISDKSYIAKMKLGITSDTLDITGKILSESSVSCKKDDIEKLLPNFIGEIEQIPPMYSAVQKDGVHLYELARKGIDVEREKRNVTVYDIHLLSSDETNNEYELFISCSSGTYVRTIISDIGSMLGCGAVMTNLRRTSACGFDISKCYSLEEIEKLKADGDLDQAIISVEKVMQAYDSVSVTSAQATRFKNGGALYVSRLKEHLKTGIYRVYSPSNEFLGLGEISPNSDELKVAKLYL